MVMDAVRGYVQLANGLTEVTRQRAQQAAKALLQQAGAENLTSGLTKVSDLADEIVATSKSNRALLQAIVANEVEGAVARRCHGGSRTWSARWPLLPPGLLPLPRRPRLLISPGRRPRRRRYLRARRR